MTSKRPLVKNVKKRMSDSEKDRVTIEIAQMHCDGDLSISQIAEKLNIPRSTVDRLLGEARKKGYIKEAKPQFCPPENSELEIKLRRAFHLNEAIVINSSISGEVRPALGAAAARFLENIVFARSPKTELTVGLSGGMSVSQTIEKLSEGKRDVNVWPLRLMEPTPHEHHASASVLALGFARKCQSKKYHTLLIETTFLHTHEQWIKELGTIKKLTNYIETRNAWENLDIAIMGVGPITPGSLTVTGLSRIGLDYDSLIAEGIKAILNLNLLTEEGVSEKGDLFLSIPIATLKRLSQDRERHIILVAGGYSYSDSPEDRIPKIDSIELVLRAGLVNILVTDESTAIELWNRSERIEKAGAAAQKAI